MSDETLLVFGCGVTFLAVSGAYVLLRGRLLEVAASRSRTREQALEPAVEPAKP